MMYSVYSPILIVHILGGIVGLLSGFTALFVRKGARSHRRSGDVFVVSMLIMAAAGAYVSLLHGQRLNVLAAALTFYLVGTAWLTVQRKAAWTRRLEGGLLLLGLATGITGWILSLGATHRSHAIMYGVFGSAALLSSAGDVRLLLRGAITGGPRLARHLWRMCIALWIATASFFVGTAGDPTFRRTGLRARLFPQSVRDTHLPQIPVFLVLVLMFYWLWRVRRTKASREELPPAAPVVKESAS
jgi:hypothetical protein